MQIDEILQNYKELFITQKNRNHIYYFKSILPSDYYFQKESSEVNEYYSVNGIYVIDEFENKYINSNIFNKIDHSLLKKLKIDDFFNHAHPTKYFDVYLDSENKQQIAFDKINTKSQHGLVQIINSNVRNGTTRKFITNSKFEKISIEMQYDFVSCSDFFLIQDDQKNQKPLILKNNSSVTFLDNN